MMTALRLLEAEGILSKAEKGKSREILTGSSKPLKPSSTSAIYQKITIVLGFPRTEHIANDRDVLRYIEERLVKLGKEFDEIVFQISDDASSARFVKEIIPHHQTDLYIFMGAFGSIASLLQERGIAAIYLGGAFDAKDIPLIGYSATRMFSEALDKLYVYGHRRIISLLQEALIDEGSSLSTVESHLHEHYKKLGILSSNYHIPKKVKMDQLYETLEDIFRITPPTALIIEEIEYMPIVCSFFMKNKISFPEDVSLICLGQDESLAHYHPPITHTVKSPIAAGKRVIHTIRLLTNNYPDIRGSYHKMKTALDVTESIRRL